MRAELFVALLGAGMLFTAPPAQAHHSFAAEYDVKQPVTLQGVLTKIEWVNPHSWIHVDVKGPDGAIQHWAFEAGGATQLLRRRRFTKDDFPAGIEVTVRGYRSRDGSFTANGQSVKLKDGRNFFMGSTTGNDPRDTPR